MKREHRVLDFIGSWLGVFGVDWDSDFESDGYTDIWGRDVDERFFAFEETQKREQPDDTGDSYIHIA